VSTTITIRLNAPVAEALRDGSGRSGQSRAAVVPHGVRRYLALRKFDAGRKWMMPVALTDGYLTDEDAFRNIS